MTEMVTCRRGPERQAGAARPDLMDAPTLPSAQPLKHLPSRRSEPGRARHLEGPPAPLPARRPAWGEATLFDPSTLTLTCYSGRPR
jgi:hypothetical protein